MEGHAKEVMLQIGTNVDYNAQGCVDVIAYTWLITLCPKFYSLAWRLHPFHVPRQGIHPKFGSSLN